MQRWVDLLGTVRDLIRPPGFVIISHTYLTTLATYWSMKQMSLLYSVAGIMVF